jgi:gliding motility-associated-like protein
MLLIQKMARTLLLVVAFLLISINGTGQCVNPPTVTLSSTSGSTCGTTPLTVTGNTFGGSATAVTITENGAGSVSPGSSSVSPFSFTYTPKSGDAGKAIVITVTTNNPSGSPCTAAKATYTLTVNAVPAAPVVGTITKPTCLVPTGSVALSGLPSTGTWTLTRTPGAVTTTGTGTSATVSGIPPGTYTYTVTSSAGCISSSSSNVVIPSPPASPASPVQTIDCSLGSGKAVVKVTSPLGTGLTYSLDGGAFQSGTSFSSVADGTHSITVKNSSGCTTTGSSFQVMCGCANPPTVTLSKNNGTACGTTVVTVSGNTFGGSATSVTITTNGTGTVNPATAGTSPFSFTYTPAAGDAGNTVVITVTTNNPLGTPCAAAKALFTLTVFANPSAPLVGPITQPSCSSATGSVELDGLPSTGTWTLTCTPGGVITTGSGISTTVSGLASGTFNFTVTNSSGCTSVASANVVINPQPVVPTAPVIGTITQPTCIVSTGSVILSGLPSTGTWTLTRSPGGVTAIGSGTSTTILNLTQGIYTYTVTNSAGCISAPSGNIVITAQPSVPAAPVVGNITAPTCTSSTGSVVMNGLPSSGTWILTRYPGTVTSGGTGTSATLSGLPGGLYNYSVTNSAGCVSGLSANVIIPPQPETPNPPLIGTITQPGYDQPTGSVVLNGLPDNGPWTLTLSPGNFKIAGSGITDTISGLTAGTYSFTVTNSAGCTSGSSASFAIYSTNGPPDVVITNPEPVCFPSTVDLTNPKITEGSSLNLTYTYWTNSSATTSLDTPEAATEGTYYIKGTTSDGFFTIKPVIVVVYRIPVADGGPDQVLSNQFTTTLDAHLVNNYESGVWSLISGTGEISDTTLTNTAVSGLSKGKNLFLWTVTNKVCQASSDSVLIDVHDQVIPTLITPNMDGINDYFILKGSDTVGSMELIIFNRRGVQVYRNKNYDNSWNGVDYNGKPLSDDTYFYVLKKENGKSSTGYIVIRR